MAWQTDNMTSTRCLEFLLFLLLHQAYSEEAEPVFKAVGGDFEIGYCFGVDYIVVYRSSPAGEQLLGNSSADAAPVALSEDLKGRISISEIQQLLGLQISHLTHMDSGIYRRECWQSQKLINQVTLKLSVCDEEVESEEIPVNEQSGKAELLCNSSSVGLEGTAVRWYLEMHPSYRITLLLDSSVSLKPLVEELQGAVEVRDGGALLLLDKRVLKSNQHFYSLVIKGKSCLSFQNIYLPDSTERRDIFASQGDRVVLNCPSDGDDQKWVTPLGTINSSSTINQMSISFGDESEEFSLVIADASDEHSGEYSCSSSSLDLEYSLAICTKKESKAKTLTEGGDITLDCDAGDHDSQWVQWYRLAPSGQHQLLHDSKDETVAIPQRLRGRLSLSEDSSSLTISHLDERDLGVYWCVVLESPPLLEKSYYDAEDYSEDYDEEYTEEGEEEQHEDGQSWVGTDRCISKQETILTLNAVTPDRSTAPKVTAYAVGAGVAALLVAGVVGAVIAVKKKAMASTNQTQTASRSRPNQSDDIRVDPECAERLTDNDGQQL